MGLHDEQPADTSGFLGEFARDGLLNVVGGCCGTTPEHIRAIVAAIEGAEPRRIPEPPAHGSRGSSRSRSARHGLRDDRRAHERDRLGALPAPGRGRRLGRGRGRRARAGARRRERPRREHGRRPARQRPGDDDVPEPGRDRARGRPHPGDDRQLALDRARGRAEVRPGQGDRQLDQPQGGRGAVPRAGAADPPLRRGRRRDGVRRAGPGRHRRAQGRDLRPRLRPARRRDGWAPEDRSSTRTSSPSRPGSRSTTSTRRRSSRRSR